MKKTFLFFVFVLQTVLILSQNYNEMFRPQFHFTPKANWMNDPNGLVYFDGEYHLFYQYNPYGNQWGNMSWGHAVSTDLVNWSQLPVAISQTGGVAVFSGSVVVDWNNTSGFGQNDQPPMVAIYTGATNLQQQFLAYSNDKGRTWTNYSGNPVISLNNNEFRDPKVIWHEPTQQWIMVVSLGAQKKINFYKSYNLKNWQHLQTFGDCGSLSGNWECPDLFSLPVDGDIANTKWVLAVSVAPGSVQYFVGDFDGNLFLADTCIALDPNVTPLGNLVADFESGNYNGWTISGNAFGTAPAMGTLPNQQAVGGYLGSHLVNSYLNGDGTQGKMVSSPFIIEKPYINFLIGGGNHPNGTFIRLKVNDQKLAQNTGKNAELLTWENWDVHDYIGQTAQIEIVDSITGGWGHINIDHIIQSNIVHQGLVFDWADRGKDFYAAQSFSDIPDSDGRRIWLAWMSNWDYAGLVPTTPWRGSMSIPRVLGLTNDNEKIRLTQKPIEELKILRKEHVNFQNTPISNIEAQFANLQYERFELETNIQVGTATQIGFKFKKGNGQETRVTYDVPTEILIFDRSNAGLLSTNAAFNPIQKIPMPLENGQISWHIFVDNASIEIFGNQGKTVLSNLVFSDSINNGVEIFETGGAAQIISMDIWELGKSNFVPTHQALFDDEVSVFPNPLPSGEKLMVKVPEIVQNVTVAVSDAQGKILFKRNFETLNRSFQIPQFIFPVTGLYFLTMSKDGKSFTRKVIRQ